MNCSSSGDKFERRGVFGLLRNCSCLATQCNDEELGTYQQGGEVRGLQMKNTKCAHRTKQTRKWAILKPCWCFLSSVPLVLGGGCTKSLNTLPSIKNL